MSLFPQGYRAQVCSCMSPRFLRGTASATSDRLLWRGSIDSGCRTKPGGKPCRSVPLATATRLISPCLPLPGMASRQPDWLIEDGLLRDGDCEAYFTPNDIDYEAVIPWKRRLLETAWANFAAGARADLRADYEGFRNDQSHWLEDYALFRALKAKFNGAYFLEWPRELVERVPSKIAGGPRGTRRHNRPGVLRPVDHLPPGRAAEIIRPRQWRAADRRFAFLCIARFERCVVEPGTLPPDRTAPASIRRGRPARLLQRRRTVMGQSRLRLGCASTHRLSLVHRSAARDLVSRRCRPVGSLPRLCRCLARADGCAQRASRGMGTRFRLRFLPGGAESSGHLPLIAEDLGLITPDVIQLRDSQNLPGMRVLQFAFDGNPQNPHLPRNYVPNTVAYTATHDNDTTRGWFEACPNSRNKRSPCTCGNRSKDVTPLPS